MKTTVGELKAMLDPLPDHARVYMELPGFPGNDWADLAMVECQNIAGSEVVLVSESTRKTGTDAEKNLPPNHPSKVIKINP